MVEFDMARAIALWQEGLPVVPVRLNVIHQHLEELKGRAKLSEVFSKMN
ncbi:MULTISPECIES: hypothetical protein [unclassified Microcoleus]